MWVESIFMASCFISFDLLLSDAWLLQEEAITNAAIANKKQIFFIFIILAFNNI